MSDWQTWRVIDVAMPPRARNVLAAYNPEITMGEVAGMTVREFRAIPRMGKAAMQMIVDVIKQAHAGELQLRMEARTVSDLAEDNSNG